jgi:uncharacterized coiled-coil protein SlyX
MTDKAEDVKALRRWPGSVEILLEDFEWMEATIASQAAEIERLTACVAEYIVQIDEIASQAAEIAALKDDNDMLCKEGGYLLHRMDEIGASQAAEIERLRFESDQLRHVKLGLEVQVMEQAAYIERLRGRIRIAEGTLVAWLREQGGGVDPVRHALATLRNMP